ncbi:MAG: hypothetical protein NTV00_06865 [Methylococcales bacterium]|nr:hypothetical protein [Methylococcales bacterium]
MKNNDSTHQETFNALPFNPTLHMVVLSLTLLNCASQANAATTYTLTDLNSLPSGNGIIPSAINNNGLIVGAESTSGVALIYNPADGSLNNIQSLVAGGTFRAAADINASNQVVGQVVPAGATLASPNVFIRNIDGNIIDLGSFTGAKTYSTSKATAINNAGHVTGNSSAQLLCDGRAFVGSASSGGLHALSVSGWSYAYAINASGQVVGKSSPNGNCLLTDNWHAFVSTATGLKDLQAASMPIVPPGSGGSTAYKINDSGLAVGEYPFSFGAASRLFPGGAPNLHAVVWNTVNDTYIDLGHPNLSSSLQDINASGQVVGTEATYAVLGNANDGLTNLNTLVTGIPAGWNIASATDINDAGQILATATDVNAATHYVLLTPAITAGNVPATPSNLTAVATSSTQVALTWTDNATDETAQYLERCQNAGCSNFTQIASLAANITSYTDTTSSPSTVYTYRIRANNAAGYSAYSSVATATTIVLTTVALPAAPSNLTNVALSRSKVVLNWTDNANNELSTFIERCKGLNCTAFKKINSVNANIIRYTDTGLNSNTYYSYRIQAMNTSGNSAYSNRVNIKTQP